MRTHEIVTERILAKMAQGQIPWVMPWKQFLPKNFITKKAYKGINQMLLFGEGEFFLTFKQVSDLKGKVKKGSKSKIIVFWTFLEDKKDPTNEKKIPFLRYYNVFSNRDIEGIDFPETTISEFEVIPQIEDYISRIDAQILETGNQACYVPSLKEIHMPKREHFLSQSHYYQTLLHEVGHSLKVEKNDKTRENYAKEELVAEIFSALAMSFFGMDCHIDNHAAYLQSWIKALKNDTSLIVKASSEAQKRLDKFINQEVVEVVEVE